MSGLWWDDFAEGGRWRTDTRVITAEDVLRFSELSGDLNPLHLDDAYAASAGYGGRIAQGVLGLAVATGLLNRLELTSGTLVALLGVNWRFERALYPGTRVHVELALNSTRRTKRADRGIVVLDAGLLDDAGAVYQRGELTMLVRSRPVGGSAAQEPDVSR
jgi:acyl dehydratase